MGHTPEFPQEKARGEPGGHGASGCRAGVASTSPLARPHAVGTLKLGLVHWDISPAPQGWGGHPGASLNPLVSCPRSLARMGAAVPAAPRRPPSIPAGRASCRATSRRSTGEQEGPDPARPGASSSWEPRAALEGLCWWVAGFCEPREGMSRGALSPAERLPPSIPPSLGMGAASPAGSAATAGGEMPSEGFQDVS